MTVQFAAQIVRQFVEPGGGIRYSVRQRADRLFQIVHDGATLPDKSQPYWMEDRVIDGIYQTAELAVTELHRLTGGEWEEVS